MKQNLETRAAWSRLTGHPLDSGEEHYRMSYDEELLPL